MSFETKDKASQLSSNKKVRIGSRVPEENREWLKRHGIVTETALPTKSQGSFFRIKPPFWVWRISVVILVWISLLAAVSGWWGDHRFLSGRLQSEITQKDNLAGANQHLTQAVSRLREVSAIQQSEITRMRLQIQDMMDRYQIQVSGFQKSEAMTDAVYSVYESEMVRMSRHYDSEIEALRQEIAESKQTISSLEYSLQVADGVVVQADPLASTGGMTNGAIAAVNPEFQFVVINIGGLKGARVGQMVEFYHRGALVGYGQVEKIYPDFSGVKVFSSEIISVLEKGDAVFLKAFSF